MYTLKNGLKVILQQGTSNNIAAATLFIKVGSVNENLEENGLTNLTQTLLLKGTKHRSALQIAEEIEGLGGELNESAMEDYSEVSIVTASPDIYKALDVLSDCVFNPTFPIKEIEKTKKNILSQIKLKEDDKFYLCYREFKKVLFKGHPYSMPVEGTEKTIPTFTKEQIEKHYKNYYFPQNMILSVVGNFDEDKLTDTIENKFGGIRRKAKPIFSVSKRFSRKTKETVLTKKLEQSFIIVGYLGTAIKSEDYPALRVTAAVLGSGMSSHLFSELRDKRGLAYVVGAALPFRELVSPFILYIGTKPESIEESKNGLLEGVSYLQNRKITDEELSRAKNYIIGNYLIDHQTNSKRGWYLGFYELIGVSYQYDENYPKLIESVTKDDVYRVAKKYLNYPTISILKPL